MFIPVLLSAAIFLGIDPDNKPQSSLGEVLVTVSRDDFQKTTAREFAQQLGNVQAKDVSATAELRAIGSASGDSKTTPTPTNVFCLEITVSGPIPSPTPDSFCLFIVVDGKALEDAASRFIVKPSGSSLQMVGGSPVTDRVVSVPFSRRSGRFCVYGPPIQIKEIGSSGFPSASEDDSSIRPESDGYAIGFPLCSELASLIGNAKSVSFRVADESGTDKTKRALFDFSLSTKQRSELKEFGRRIVVGK